jgi:hypothetical protein
MIVISGFITLTPSPDVPPKSDGFKESGEAEKCNASHIEADAEAYENDPLSII